MQSENYVVTTAEATTMPNEDQQNDLPEVNVSIIDRSIKASLPYL